MLAGTQLQPARVDNPEHAVTLAAREVDMNAIRNLMQRLRSDERGLTTVEYAIVLCLIAAVVVGVWKEFGSEVKEKLTKSKDHIGEEMQAGIDSFQQ